MIAEIFVTYLFGYFCGLGTAAFLAIYFLSATASTSDNSKRTHQSRKQEILREECTTDESRKILDDAIRQITNLQTGRSDVQICESDECQEIPNMTPYDLEQKFQELCLSSKHRVRQLKNIASFVADVGKTYLAFSKDLCRLSVTARSYVKSFEGVNGDGGSDSKVETAEKNLYTTEWWIALSTCLEHLSNDCDSLSDKFSQDISVQILQACDDQHAEDKTLFLEGSGLLTQLKDSLMNNEPLVQERDKWRIKVSRTWILYKTMYSTVILYSPK